MTKENKEYELCDDCKIPVIHVAEIHTMVGGNYLAQCPKCKKLKVL